MTGSAPAASRSRVSAYPKSVSLFAKMLVARVLRYFGPAYVLVWLSVCADEVPRRRRPARQERQDATNARRFA